MWVMGHCISAGLYTAYFRRSREGLTRGTVVHLKSVYTAKTVCEVCNHRGSGRPRTVLDSIVKYCGRSVPAGPALIGPILDRDSDQVVRHPLTDSEKPCYAPQLSSSPGSPPPRLTAPTGAPGMGPARPNPRYVAAVRRSDRRRRLWHDQVSSPTCRGTCVSLPSSLAFDFYGCPPPPLPPLHRSPLPHDNMVSHIFSHDTTPRTH